MRIWSKLLIGLVLITVGTSALAGNAKTAQGLYSLAMAKEKAKDYQGAVELYQSSLRELPNYSWSYRQLGNCYYYLGQKEQALESYNLYLAAFPKDEKIRAFADRLRTSAPPQALVMTTNDGAKKLWSVYLDGGLALLGSSDFKKFGGGTTTGPDSAWAALIDFGLAYRIVENIDLFGRIVLGPYRGAKYDAPTVPGLKATVDVQEMSLLFGGAYILARGIHRFGAGLGVGPAVFTGTYGQTWEGHPTATGGYDFTGMTWVVEPELTYELMLSDHWGLRGVAGYRLARFDTLNVSKQTGAYANAKFANPAVFTDGSRAYFDQSGPSIRMGVSWH